MIDYICLAMLIFMRKQSKFLIVDLPHLVLDRDEQSPILQRLLRYPPVEEMKALTRLVKEQKGMLPRI